MKTLKLTTIGLVMILALGNISSAFGGILLGDATNTTPCEIKNETKVDNGVIVTLTGVIVTFTGVIVTLTNDSDTTNENCGIILTD